MNWTWIKAQCIVSRSANTWGQLQWITFYYFLPQILHWERERERPLIFSHYKIIYQAFGDISSGPINILIFTGHPEKKINLQLPIFFNKLHQNYWFIWLIRPLNHQINFKILYKINISLVQKIYCHY